MMMQLLTGTFSDDLMTARIQFGIRMVVALAILVAFAILFQRWVNRK